MHKWLLKKLQCVFGSMSHNNWTGAKSGPHPCDYTYKFCMTCITMYKIAAAIVQLGLNPKTL